MRILLAEDDVNISVIAKLALEKLGGFEVTVVHDGEQALESALNSNFDLILLDEMMPKMNGLRVSQQYRAQCTTPLKPIIFLSAKSQESDIREFIENGIGFIPKPFDPTQISSQIQDILRQHGAVAA